MKKKTELSVREEKTNSEVFLKKNMLFVVSLSQFSIINCLECTQWTVSCWMFTRNYVKENVMMEYDDEEEK